MTTLLGLPFLPSYLPSEPKLSPMHAERAAQLSIAAVKSLVWMRGLYSRWA